MTRRLIVPVLLVALSFSTLASSTAAAATPVGVATYRAQLTEFFEDINPWQGYACLVGRISRTDHLPTAGPHAGDFSICTVYSRDMFLPQQVRDGFVSVQWDTAPATFSSSVLLWGHPKGASARRWVFVGPTFTASGTRPPFFPGAVEASLIADQRTSQATGTVRFQGLVLPN
jgi:hypothetical protein